MKNSIARAALSAVAVVLATVAAGQQPATEPPSGPGWIEVGYRDLVDLRQPSHSGDPVGVLLDRLAGRPVPSGGARPEDLHAHALLDPLLEPYGYVLIDALDTVGSPPDPPMVEIGSLWEPGTAEPAWVELLRARRYVVESDGRGRIRACLPLPPGMLGVETVGVPSVEGGRLALDAAWPVLRHVLASERFRAAAAVGPGEEPPPTRLSVHPYVHHPARTSFHLGVEPYATEITETARRSGRPPLDLEAWRRFLDRGLRLEGARLGPDGNVILLGSESPEPPSMLGDPIDLSDFAVAYRAVFHGGLSEPYMSLDRGYDPWTSVVNYGGRLRDTRLGMVSLLCDVRFKTFSLGIDVLERADVRQRIRDALPGFRTHVEHFAADPRAGDVFSQQTRLWFYPDDVDLTISEQADVLVLRRVRMTAASERVSAAGEAAAEDPPWTRATVRAVNADYDALAGLFPELGDLDQVVRLLSLFTWLRAAEREGHLLPDLDALLALSLPAYPTPRDFPQLLAFNALPPSDGPSGVETYEKLNVAEALDRLRPVSGLPLPARSRFERAVSLLDPRLPDHARLRGELEKLDPNSVSEVEFDAGTYRAERLRMHQLVLSSLGAEERQTLAARYRQGEPPRVFSVGIGGLDLGMGRVVDRAAGRRLGLGHATAGGDMPDRGTEGQDGDEDGREVPVASAEAAAAPDSTLLPRIAIPDHGLDAGPIGQTGGELRTEHRSHFVVSRSDAGGSGTAVLVVTGRDGPEAGARETVTGPGSQPPSIRRLDRGRRMTYFLEDEGDRLAVTVRDSDSSPSNPLGTPAEPATGTALLRLGGTVGDSHGPTVPIRLTVGDQDLSGDYPRRELSRLVIGRDLDVKGDPKVPGLLPPPGRPGDAARLLVIEDPATRRPPWIAGAPARPGEEDAAVVARALAAWQRAAGGGTSLPVAVGTRPGAAAAWADAPAPDARAILLMPEATLVGMASGIRASLNAAWTGTVRASLPDTDIPDLVVLVSAESPGVLGARLRALASDPALSGRLLAVWSLSGPLRADLPAALLEHGALAGLGVAEVPMQDWGDVAEQLGTLSSALAESDGPVRVENLPGPLLWFF